MILTSRWPSGLGTNLVLESCVRRGVYEVGGDQVKTDTRRMCISWKTWKCGELHYLVLLELALK